MTDDSPFADWYDEGNAIPVCHPLPECSATIEFADEDTLIWEVTNHETGKTYTERFEREEFSEQEIDTKMTGGR